MVRSTAVVCFCFFMGAAFSILLLFSGSLLFFWFFLELSGLMLVPCFFFCTRVNLSSLLTYLIMTGLSSFFIISGLLLEGFFLLVLLGFLMKLGIFPFFFWVYVVLSQANWAVMLGISTFLKLPLVLFYGVLSPAPHLVWVLGATGLVFIAFFFWVCSVSWEYVWAHLSLASTASFFVVSPTASFSGFVFLFCFYLIWGCLCVWFLSGGWMSSGLFCWCWFLFLFLSAPVSASVVYKFFLGCLFLGTPTHVLLSWVFYSISEQVFLLKFLVSGYYPKWDTPLFYFL